MKTAVSARDRLAPRGPVLRWGTVLRGAVPVPPRISP